IRMFERVRTPVLGVVENMSGFTCPHCGGHADIFGDGGGRKLAEDMNLPLLASVPLDVAVRLAGDLGRPTTISAPDSPAGKAFAEMAERVLGAVSGTVATGA
ncbi:MAG: P-loop NTPase, partial [Longimicrobiales bacterium]